MLLVVVALAVQLAGARARAQTAADLGAVAAAMVRAHAVELDASGPLAGGAMCAAAQRSASGSGGVLRSCRGDGPDVRVEVAVLLDGLAARVVPGGAVMARARAGPVVP